MRLASVSTSWLRRSESKGVSTSEVHKLVGIDRAPDGRLHLSARLYDAEGELLAEIVDNEWVSGNPLPWDLDARFSYLKIRNGLRQIALKMDARKDPTNGAPSYKDNPNRRPSRCTAAAD
jgi:hypothetical protein